MGHGILGKVNGFDTDPSMVETLHLTESRFMVDMCLWWVPDPTKRKDSNPISLDKVKKALASLDCINLSMRLETFVWFDIAENI